MYGHKINMDSLKCKFTRVVGGASDSTDLCGSCNQPVLKLRKYHRKGLLPSNHCGSNVGDPSD